MKAKEYFEQNKDRLLSSDVAVRDEATHDIFKGLLQEALDIKAARRCVTVGGQAAILREMNQKWNALASIVEKESNNIRLLRNGFLIVMLKSNPQLEPCFPEAKNWVKPAA